jgi:hypothetical protein
MRARIVPSGPEVATLDAAANLWTREYRQQPDTECLFWPLIDYPDRVGAFIRHHNTMPLVERALGGRHKVRFQQCNWRQYPVGYGQRRDSSGQLIPSARAMAFHADSNLPSRHTRQPYAPLDYVSCFTYLSDTNPRTPALCVVSHPLIWSSGVLVLALRPWPHGAVQQQDVHGPQTNCYRCGRSRRALATPRSPRRRRLWVGSTASSLCTGRRAPAW